MQAKKHKILVVGQTPPPYCGQSIMIEAMLTQKYKSIELIHIRMAFSDEIDEIGKFKLTKIWHLITLITKIIFTRFSSGARVLYYPPAGPNRLPIYRDFAILICTRWLFSRTVFHFHAGGLSTIYNHLTSVEKFFFRSAYSKPEGAILLSKLNPRDDTFLNAKHKFVIPYGIEDHFQEDRLNRPNQISCVLFVGVLTESKGVLILIEAIKILQQKNIPLVAKLMGKFESPEFEKHVRSLVTEYNIETCIEFLGVQTGNDKWHQFYHADIFCFPTFYESETFGLVVLEAMQFQLPTIVTNWRGVPSLVKDGETGFIVEPSNADEVATRIEFLTKNPNVALQFGRRGRQEYIKRFKLGNFRAELENAFVSVIENSTL